MMVVAAMVKLAILFCASAGLDGSHGIYCLCFPSHQFGVRWIQRIHGDRGRRGVRRYALQIRDCRVQLALRSRQPPHRAAAAM